MKRFALFAVSALVMACAVGRASGPKTLENRPDGRGAPGAGGRSVLPDGAYMCSFSESGYEYPPFECRVSTGDGRTRLEKLGGSQRIRGTVTFTDAGFRFEGEFYCPYGDCTANVTGEFRVVDNGMYQGTLEGSNSVVVLLTYLPDGFAGGGDVYGYGGGYYGYGGSYYGAPY